MAYIPRRRLKDFTKHMSSRIQTEGYSRLKYRLSFFGILVLMAALISLIFSTYNLFVLDSFKDELARTQNVLTNKINDLNVKFEDKLKDINRFLGPQGIIDKYIVASNIIMNEKTDIARILTEIQDDEKTGYFRIFISGPEKVWVGIKAPGSQTYIYQKEFLPGLSEEKFYFFKKPPIETAFTIEIPKEISIRTGDPIRTYLLLNYLGSYKVIKIDKRSIDYLFRYIGLKIQ